MQIIADLQIHSRFSRAVSKEMTLPNIHAWARRKGIGLMATGDWMHPMWFREIEKDLEETGTGLLKLRQTNGALQDVSFTAHPSNLNSLSSSIAPIKDVTVLEKTHPAAPDTNPLFLLATEVSCIYSQGGKGRRVHTLVWVPSLNSARKISAEMTKRGCNLLSDGRPIIGLTSINVAELVLTIEPKALVIPAHAWTPWFSLYGSMSGFDSIEEAFGPYAKYIYAVETGLSSSPDMNWRIKELDNRTILSFSDAHSGPKLGREATVFEIKDEHKVKGQDGCKMIGYEDIYEAIVGKSTAEVEYINFDSSPVSLPSTSLGASAKKIVYPEHVEGQSGSEQNFIRSPQINLPRISYTIEFFPEEGKYHYTGHRVCNIRLNPDETVKQGTACPVCGKPLTQGVMQRVEELAGRSEKDLQLSKSNFQISDTNHIQITKSNAFPSRPGFVSLVPLQEIISESIGSPVASNKTQQLYSKLTNALSSEFYVLMSASKEEIAGIGGERLAEGIDKVRRGDIVVDPGYDGVFGVVKIWKEGAQSLVDESKKQLRIF